MMEGPPKIKGPACAWCGDRRWGGIKVRSRQLSHHAVAIEVYACRECVKQCSTCGERFIEDEMSQHKLSCEWECEPCRLQRFIDNDQYVRVPSQKAELARWVVS
jgi:hypothetical protein